MRNSKAMSAAALDAEYSRRYRRNYLLRVIILIVLGTILFFGGCSAYRNLSVTNTERDRSAVVVKKRLSMVFFYRDDCPDCHKIFKTVYLAQQAKVPIQFVNLSGSRNRKYKNIYHLKTVPTFVLLNNHGTEISRYSGTNLKRVSNLLKHLKEQK